MKKDKTYKDMINSFGFAIIVSTVLVSVGKATTSHYFTVAIVAFALVVVPLAYLDYRRSRGKWLKSKEGMLQKHSKAHQFNMLRRKAVRIKEFSHNEVMMLKRVKKRSHSDGLIYRCKMIYKHDAHDATIEESSKEINELNNRLVTPVLHGS